MNRITHGMTGTSEHRAWINMRRRCMNPSDSGFRRYGGRGISICERWESFENFISDMGRKPSPSHSLDRINNAGNYEPSNCRWASQVVQGGNTRAVKVVETPNGKMSLRQAALLYKMNYSTVCGRINRSGWRVEDALTVKRGTNASRTPKPKGVNNLNAKLNDAAVAEIRSLYHSGGHALMALSHKFNVSQTLVAKIVNREIWKHL